MLPAQTTVSRFTAAALRVAFFVLLVIWVAVVLVPISNRPLRLACVGTPFLTLGVLLLALWRTGWHAWFTRIFAAVLALIAVAAVLLGIHFYVHPLVQGAGPGLRAAYVASLRSYLGSPYVWGGENRLGIDCSGLVRKAYIYAVLKAGLASGSKEFLPIAARLWWNDTTAQHLAERNNWNTQKLGPIPSLNTVDPARLLPGDLAVTRSGIHVLAYLGEGQWINADPVSGRTVMVQAPGESSWLHGEMQLVRWNMLMAP